jgi:hypothetical protein
MSSTYFIVGAQTAEYLEQLMYEADLEAYKKLKRKRKKRYENIYSSSTLRRN